MIRRFLLWPLAVVLALIALYLLWAAWAYRDIPVELLEQKYGGAALRKLDAGGVALRYKLDGRGPAVVLIHSNFYDMGMWDGWAQALQGQYRVLRYDLTSHGLTGPHPANDYSMQEDLRLLEALMDALEIRQAHIVGSSLGGNIAFHFAARHPQRTLSLTLVNSGGLKAEAARGRGGGIPSWAYWILRLLPSAACRSFVDWMIVSETADIRAVSERFHAMLRRAGNRRAELERMRQFRYRDNRPLLAGITAPVLLLWGADNPHLPATQTDEFASLLTSSVNVVAHKYPRSGHVLPLERPQKTAADFRRFIERL